MRPDRRTTPHAALREACRGLVDGALRHRHRPRLLRGLDLARALRARARRHLPPDVAERRSGRAAARGTAATSPRSSTPPARRWSSCETCTARCAFHNICRHRGNKLVWNDYPREEVSGTCRQFTCKYHGWRYGLDGALTFVQQESEFFDLDKSDFGLVPVRCEVWEGFVFVNLDNEDTTPLADYLGGLAEGIAGYPFHRMTQVHKYRAEIGGNWKLFIDAFAEFYHAPVLPRSSRCPTSPASSRASASRRWPTASTAPTRWCRRGAACRRPRTRAWSSPSSRSCAAACSARGTRPTSASTSCRRASTRPGTRPGASTRSCSSRTSCCWSGSRTGTSRTTTGRPRTTRTSSRGRCTSCPRRTPTSGCSRSSRS